MGRARVHGLKCWETLNISSAISCCSCTARSRSLASAYIRSASARSLSAAALCCSISARISSAARRDSSADFRVSSANRRNDSSARRASSEAVLSRSEATRLASASSCRNLSARFCDFTSYFGLLAPGFRRVGFHRHCAPPSSTNQWAVDLTAVITAGSNPRLRCVCVHETVFSKAALTKVEKHAPPAAARHLHAAGLALETSEHFRKPRFPGAQTKVRGFRLFRHLPRAFEPPPENRRGAPAVNPDRLDGRGPCPDPAERSGAWLHPFRGLAPWHPLPEFDDL